MNELEKMIQQRLLDVVWHCDFKKAWIPKGWSCVKIEKFAKELAEEIRKNAKKYV